MATQSKIRLKRSGLKPSVSIERIKEAVRNAMEGDFTKANSASKKIEEGKKTDNN